MVVGIKHTCTCAGRRFCGVAGHIMFLINLRTILFRIQIMHLEFSIIAHV